MADTVAGRRRIAGALLASVVLAGCSFGGGGTPERAAAPPVEGITCRDIERDAGARDRLNRAVYDALLARVALDFSSTPASNRELVGATTATFCANTEDADKDSVRPYEETVRLMAETARRTR